MNLELYFGKETHCLQIWLADKKYFRNFMFSTNTYLTCDDAKFDIAHIRMIERNIPYMNTPAPWTTGATYIL